MTIANGSSSAISGNSSKSWVLNTDGAISSSDSASPAISFAGAGSIINGASNASANISGFTQAIVIGADGSVTNSGIIRTTATGKLSNSGAIIFNGGSNTVVNNASGQIIGSVNNGRAIATAVGATATITNAGVIKAALGTNANAIYLASGGAITNQANAAITSTGTALVVDRALATVTNSGTMSGDVAGVNLIAGGTVTNNLGGSIAITGSGSGQSAVRYLGGTANILNNYGSLDAPNVSGEGVSMFSGGTINNYATGVISGDNGSRVQGGIATVNNYGQILGNTTSSFSGLQIANGGTIHNYDGAVIKAAARGLYLVNGGAVFNDANATIAAVGTNETSFNYAGGIFVGNGSGTFTATITNAGTISSVANPGISFYGSGSSAIATGSVTNNAGGRISGASGIVISNTNASVFAPQVSIINQAGATITGTTANGVDARNAPLSLINGGTITAAVIGVRVVRGGSITNQAGGQIISSGNGVVAQGSQNTSVDSSGVITAGSGFNAVLFSSGNNSLYLRSGSTTTGLVTMGTGVDSATVYGGANIDNVPMFDGFSSQGSLTFEGYSGIARSLQRWNTVEALNGANVHLDGAETYSATTFHTDAQSILGFSAVNGTLTGTVNNEGQLNYTAGNGAGAYTIAGNLTNSGTIALGGASAAGSTLTINGNYVGNNGILRLNSMLGGDASATDRLVITGAGHSATGSTSLIVTNVGGVGGETTNGIMVVQTANGATTGANAFMLGRRVAAGAYDYFLYRGGADGNAANAENWYLRSAYSPPPTQPMPEPGLTPDPTPISQPAPVPNRVQVPRPELPTNSVILPLAIQYGYAMLDTLHERVGETWIAPTISVTEERAVRCADRSQNYRCVVRVQAGSGRDETHWARSGWARLFGNQGEHQQDNYGKGSPNYDYTFGGIQAGLDLYAREQADGTLDKAGIYIGYGQVSSNVGGLDGAYYGPRAGTVDMDAYTLGGYWTHRSASGWYTDAVVQGTRYTNTQAKSVLNETLKPDGFGILGSLEGGYSFKLGSGWALEPQAQIVYQNVTFGDANDSFGRFRFQDGESLRGRLGLRVTKSWNSAGNTDAQPRLMTVWLRGNIWHEFLGNTKTAVQGFTGENQLTTLSSLKGTWGEIGAGATAQITDKLNLFVTGAYQHALDGKGSQGWDGRVGMTVKW